MSSRCLVSTGSVGNARAIVGCNFSSDQTQGCQKNRSVEIFVQVHLALKKKKVRTSIEQENRRYTKAEKSKEWMHSQPIYETFSRWCRAIPV